MSEINLLSEQFCADVDAILANYWRGYYSEALAQCDMRLKDHGGELTEWERAFIQSVQIYLRTWDQDSACVKFLRVIDLYPQSAGVETQWIRFYQLLLYIWLNCQERANFDCLVDARRRADEATSIFNRIGREKMAAFAEPLKRYPFLPRPWCVFWFRALARHSLADHDGARKDFERAHRELYFTSENQRDPEPREKSVRLKIIRDYCRKHALLAGRLYSDMGMFLFERGDMRTAKEALELAVNTPDWNVRGDDKETDRVYIKKDGIDPANPYAWANLGFVSYSFKRDDEAIDALLEAYRLASSRRNSSGDEYYASGRIYYFLGAFAYRWLRRAAHPYEDDVEGELESKLANLSTDERRIFGQISGVREALSLAFTNYLRARDVARALPALFVAYDLLSSPTSDDPIVVGARRLLWEYSYGMGDFLAIQTRYQRMTDQYLLEGMPFTVEDAK